MSREQICGRKHRIKNGGCRTAACAAVFSLYGLDKVLSNGLRWVAVQQLVSFVAMSSSEATATASRKLAEALQEFVRSEASSDTENGRKPSKWDVFFFVIFAANLALLTWSIPAEALKSEQLEFFEKIIPAVGGSLFALLAAWFKQKTLDVTQNRWFRWGQIPLSVFALLLGAPILPLHLRVQPADGKAILYLDKSDQDHLRDWKDTVWVRFTEHDFIAKHYDSDRWNERIFHWKRRDLAAMWWRGEADLSLLYTVRMDLPDSGLTVSIQKMKAEFDDDFLRADMLAPQQLTKVDRHRIVFTPVSTGDLSPLTKLPVGDYELVTSKTGCESSLAVPLIIPPSSNPEQCEVELKPVRCAH
jgi:hypothetical protein